MTGTRHDTRSPSVPDDRQAPRGLCLVGFRPREVQSFPPLAGALEMLGADPSVAEAAADAVETYHDRQDGVSVRGDVV